MTVVRNPSVVAQSAQEPPPMTPRLYRSAGLGVGKAKAYIETNEPRAVDAKGVKTRYVRLYSNGNTSNDMNHYIEVEVFGRPAA